MSFERSSRRRPRRRTVLLVAALAVPVLLAPYVTTSAQAAAIAPVTSRVTADNPADTTPHARDGEVKAFAEIGNTVYAGGTFTQLKPAKGTAWTTQRYLFAFDRTTGALRTAFKPVLDNVVNALAVNPDGKLIVGGGFRTVNGVARRGMVALDPVTGATVTTWAGVGDGGVVRRLVVHGNHLYAAGAFNYVNGRRHNLLARLNASTGAVDQTFQIDATVARVNQALVWSMAVSPDGRTLVAVGNFTLVNGLSRNQVVMVDLSGTPTVANWRTTQYQRACSKTFPFYARDVDFSDDGSYFVIVSDGGAPVGTYCDVITRWETAVRGDNLSASWVTSTGNDSVTAVEAADEVVYAAGHFRWVNNINGQDTPGNGAVDRFGYAALNPINGMPMRWNPTRSGAPAGTKSWGPIVSELWRGSAGIYAGFDSDGAGREYHGRLALFPLAGGRVVAPAHPPAGTAGYLYLGAGNGRLTRVPLNGRTVGTPAATSQPAMTSAGAAFMAGNRLYWSQKSTTVASGALLRLSTFNRGKVGAPWTGSNFNRWFDASSMTGAFYRDGRMYYIRSGVDQLFFRYLEPDGAIVGDREFVVPAQQVFWGRVRGMTLVGDRIVFGSTTGALSSVTFDGNAVTSAPSRVAQPTTTLKWSSPTLFFATS